MNFKENRVMLADSYKYSHYLQYPKNAVNSYSYAEARSTKEYEETLFFGLQMIWKKYFSEAITIEEVNEAEMYAEAHGVPFNRNGWNKIINKYNGYLPVTIKAVPEGTVVPNKMVLFTVELTNNDKDLVWVPSWLETFLMKVWYTCTVATRSYYVKKMILENAKMTSETPFVNFTFHSFGDRGSSSTESAALGGVAHLVLFDGTDNFNSLRYANLYMNQDIDKIAFSIPATEHSTTTSWGKDNEFEMIDNHLETNKGRPLIACVIDSYDTFNFTDKITSGKFKEKIESDNYPKLVLRPDSGYAPDIINEMLNIMEKNGVQFTVNSKGYKTFKNYGLLWGDGINMETMNDILTVLRLRGYSSDNIAFGSGGWLMQQHNRDTLGFAIKCSNITFEDGTEMDVFKDPITDKGKTSKRGKVTTYFDRANDTFEVDLVNDGSMGRPEILETVIENGKLIKEFTLTEVRENTQKCLEGKERDIF